MPQRTKSDAELLLKQFAEEQAASLADRRKSLRVGRSAMFVGIVGTSLGQLLLFGITLAASDLNVMATVEERMLANLCFHFFVFICLTAPAGVICAWTAHHWFHRSTISVTLMTIVLAVVADVTIIGWMMIALLAGG